MGDPAIFFTEGSLRFCATTAWRSIPSHPCVVTLGPMGLYGPIATLWNGGADQLKFPADQLKLHGCVHFSKETCVCGFKMSKKSPSDQSRNDARPIVAAGRPRMIPPLYMSLKQCFISRSVNQRNIIGGLFHVIINLHPMIPYKGNVFCLIGGVEKPASIEYLG